MLTWQVLLDWDGDGSYAYDETAYLMDPLSLDRGRDNEFADMQVGKLSLTLDNSDRRFDPWYVNGPLYGLIVPGVGVRLDLTYDGVTYRLFTGQLEDIRDTGELGNRVARVTCYDGWRFLKESECNVALQEGKRVDELIALVLDSIGWPVGERELQQGDTFGYFWTPKRSAAHIISGLARSDHGLFFVDRYGKAVYRNRATIVSGSTVGSLGGDYKADIQTNTPWESVYSRVKVTAHPVTLAPEGTIWKLVDRPSVASGQSIEIWVEYTDINGQACAAKEVAVGGYTANAASDGSGTDLTAHLSVTVTAFSTSARVTMQNVGPDTLFVTKLEMIGQALTLSSSTIKEEAEATRKRELVLDLPYQQDVLVALDLARALLSFYSEPRLSVTWPMDMHLPDLVAFDLSDRVHVTETNREIDEAMRVGRIGIETAGSMQAISGELLLESCNNVTFWLLGIPGNSELGITTRLGY